MTEQGHMEGFICPICMVDLCTLSLLLKHFESSHAEDKALVNQLKGLFGKAKDKLNITRNDSFSSISNDNSSQEFKDNNEITDVEIWSKQKIGKNKNHTELFCSHRRSKIDFMVIDTNKTMIRLQKIANINVKAYDKRKEMEQTLVPWAPDDACTICMICGVSFQTLLLKLRHHCRLCGCAICHDCSHFLPLKTATRIVANEVIRGSSVGGGGGGPYEDEQAEDADPFVYEASGSEYGIRMCRVCRATVQRQTAHKASNTVNELLIQLYEKLSENMNKATENFTKFQDSNTLLKNGNGSFNETNLLKERVIKLNDNVNVISKKISLLSGSVADDKLKRMIRVMAVNFIQNHIHELGDITTEQQIKDQIREARITKDPVAEQIDIIKGYIRTAQQKGKTEDVAILKNNLKDLERFLQDNSL